MRNPSYPPLKRRSSATERKRVANRVAKQGQIRPDEHGVRVFDALLSVDEASALRDLIDRAIERVQTTTEEAA